MIRIIGGGLAGCEAAWQAASLGVVSSSMKCGRCDRPPFTRPIAWRSSSAATPSAETSWTTPSGSSRRRCGGLVRSSCGRPKRPGARGRCAGGGSRDVRAGGHGRRARTSAHHRCARGGDRRSPTTASMCRSIVATGPLTSETLSADIARLVGADHLYFYDAISPIVLAETIDRGKVVPGIAMGPEPPAALPTCQTPRRSRVSGVRRRRWQGDYLNCPLTRGEYGAFYDALRDRRVSHRPRFRQGEVLRGLPADRGHGAPRARYAALRAR